MQTIKATALFVAAALFLGTTAYAATDVFAIQTALSAPPAHSQLTISVAADQVLELTARDLELRMGLEQGALRGVTVTALPTYAQGAFTVDGVELEVYEYLDRAELDRLCFRPNETATAASITFMPQGGEAVSTSLSVSILPKSNQAPEIENASYATVKNVAIAGQVTAGDPEGDALSIQVVSAPQRGEVVFDGLWFTYTPYRDITGTDSFTVCAVDSHHNYSREAAVEIAIENPRVTFQYADMSGSPSEYAAIKLYETGTLQGKKVGGRWFFQPAQAVTRGEFLVMLLGVSGMDAELEPTVNTGLPGDQELPGWLKPYVKKAVKEGILPVDAAFAHSEIPTRAEAVALCSRTAKISDVKEYELQINDVVQIPGWAVQSYKELAAYRMLDLHDGNAYPGRALTNSYCADLLWQLWKHCNR